MSFSAFSKEFTANMFTAVENQFIVKYLPQASGDAVRVYLYGLYLANCKEDFDGASLAKLLKLPYAKVLEIFSFWEECELVHVLSKEPLLVEYLPVNSAVGKPKPLRPEKYKEFNRELFRILQKSGKDFKPYEMQRILELMEENPIEPQAVLLIAEYCARKDGERFNASHILNKAKKLCAEHKYTYEQVEHELQDFNTHERELTKIFTLLGIYRKPQENDYDYLEKWEKLGMQAGAVYECAAALKKGTLATLDSLVCELEEKGICTASDAKEYLARREELAATVYQVARKLGVKVPNPRPYIEEYAERWLERGYEKESLTLLASLCFRLGEGFAEMDALIDKLYAEGIVDGTGIKEYCAARDAQLKTLQAVQNVLGTVKRSASALDMISAWQSWSFSNEMILEAARRSSTAASPLPYMNKLLSEWKRTGITTKEAIPAQAPRTAAFQSEVAATADRRTERERYYSLRRERAEAAAERARARAEEDEAFRLADAAVKKGEIEVARAEVFTPETLPSLQKKLREATKARREALTRIGLSERDFLPAYHCKKCSDSGFLPNGVACDCYKEN